MFDVETSVGFLLAKAYQRMHRHFRSELQPYGLTPPQFALLAFLWRRDGMSQRELSERTEIDRTTLCGLLDRLEQAGLVERQTNRQDRRSYRVFLTPGGKALEEELTPVVMRARQRFTGALSADEYHALCDLLNKLRAKED